MAAMSKTVLKARIARSLSLAMLSAAASSVVLAQGPPPDAIAGTAYLAVPSKSMELTDPAPRGKVAPVFSRGYFTQFKRHGVSPTEPNIYLHDSSGNLAHKVVLWPSGAVGLDISSVDVGPNSTLVAAGETITSDGAKHPFLATSNLDGTKPQVFMTGTWLPTHVVLADDGSIWCLGGEQMDAGDTISPVKRSNFDTVRHYGPAGNLLGQLLPRWGANTAYVVYSLPGGTPIHAYDSANNELRNFCPCGPHTSAKDSDENWLRANGTGFVLYDGSDGKLYRYSTSGPSMTTTRVNRLYRGIYTINGFAVASDGTVYASMVHTDLAIPFSHGLFELVPGASDGLWLWEEVVIDPSTNFRSRARASVLGTDNTSVVFSPNVNKVDWLEVK